jgi:hypothetical protein
LKEKEKGKEKERKRKGEKEKRKGKKRKEKSKGLEVTYATSRTSFFRLRTPLPPEGVVKRWFWLAHTLFPSTTNIQYETAVCSRLVLSIHFRS